MGWELEGEDVTGKEVGSPPGKREVRCSAAREMCVSRGYLSGLVPGDRKQRASVLK